jgi:hypothetical protein
MFHTFPNIKITLLVGIGGGVPFELLRMLTGGVYLGVVVAGWPEDGGPAVNQFDLGRWKVHGNFEKHGSIEKTPLFFVLCY